MSKGFLALDIDGTLTAEKSSIPINVASFLKAMFIEGWTVIVSTGRSYPFAIKTVESLDFPYVLSTQNGSSAWLMPDKKNIYTNYIDRDKIAVLQNHAKNLNLAFVLYGNDFNLYGAQHEEYDAYLNKLAKIHHQEMNLLDSTIISKSPNLESIPLAKLIGNIDEVKQAKKIIDNDHDFDTSIIADPFHEGFYILLITKKGVNKGYVVDFFVKNDEVVIAAGNDNNDLSMFEKAHISIGMEDGSKDVIKAADIIAPSAKKEGIIIGLKKAIEKVFQVKKTTKNPVKTYSSSMSIGFQDLILHANIGTTLKERELKQPLYLSLEAKLYQLPEADELNDSFDYDILKDLCKKIAEESNFNLLESLAKKISNELLSISKIKKIDLTIKKPNAIAEASYSFVKISSEAR